MFVCQPNILTLFDSWMYFEVAPQHVQSWRLTFFALSLFIWSCKNKIVFRQEEADSSLRVDLFRYNFVWWSKNVKGSGVPSVSDIFHNLEEVSVPPQHCSPVVTSWVPPSVGTIKINVDESFYMDINRCGIGGLFRDQSENMFLHFAKEVVTDSTILTEIHMIREGLLIAATSRWSSSSQFLLELDSANAVTWFKDPKIAPWKFKIIIRESIQPFGRHLSWCFSHTRLIGNDTADVLAHM